jgi:hypothetical protein
MMSPQRFNILWAASGFTPTHPDAVREMASEKTNRLPAKTHRIVKISPGVVVKYGLLVNKKEAENMMIMAKNTSIPVPKVLAYGTFGPYRRSARSNEICDGQFYETYIYMTLAKGQTLENVWDSCDDSSRKAISKQLTTYLEQLRKLEGSYIGSLNSGPVLDMASPSIKSKGTYSRLPFQGLLTSYVVSSRSIQNGARFQLFTHQCLHRHQWTRRPGFCSRATVKQQPQDSLHSWQYPAPTHHGARWQSDRDP